MKLEAFIISFVIVQRKCWFFRAHPHTTTLLCRKLNGLLSVCNILEYKMQSLKSILFLFVSTATQETPDTRVIRIHDVKMI